MTPGGQLAAAIEILGTIETDRQPAADVLKQWGLRHRFAGSKDRAAVASLIYDALRRRASAAWIMGDDAPRAVMLGSLLLARDLDPAAVAALCSGDAHAPAPLSPAEEAALARPDLDTAPVHVRGDAPEWLCPALAETFANDLVDELQAMAKRAPIDVRINPLRANPAKVRASLAHHDPQPGTYAVHALRFEPGADGRGPAFAGEPAFIKGMIEVQDEGSQIAVQLAAAQPGEQVLDLCAGAGGKTLALAAAMNNRGQIYATDRDGRRLANLYPRLDRSGARNVQIRAPRKGVPPLSDLVERCDCVLVDAPCTGTGTWRRNPDAKWRMRPGALDQRLRDQDDVLDDAAPYVKAGGRLVYVTCSVLVAENEDRVSAFLERHPDFTIVPPVRVAAAAGLPTLVDPARPLSVGIRLTPLRTGTDGFFVATLTRRPPE